MIKFRPQRGGLAEAMAEAVELPDRSALVAHINKQLEGARGSTGAPLANNANLVIEPYGGADPRIGWSRTFVVTLRDWGIVGFTDSSE
ncbi:hypothetical protein [Enterovirga sp. CN4-39]|uniref:hypothetical protein n=1 Tax=Enterovirga sp. CN4-39 TaxID=3400910 RepID=UPI003C001AAF